MLSSLIDFHFLQMTNRIDNVLSSLTKRDDSVKSKMKEWLLQQIPMKYRGSLESILKTYFKTAKFVKNA